MDTLYSGELPAANVSDAIREVETIRRELAAFPPSDLVWDYEFRDRRPPWGDETAAEITNLAENFVTSDGKNLFDVMSSAFRHAQQKNLAVLIP